MRPSSIIWFERLYLAAILVGLINTAIGWPAVEAQIAANPDAAGLSMNFVLGSVLVSTALQLLLWYLAARRRSGIARWIIVVLTLIGVAATLFSIMAGTFPGGLAGALGALALALQVGAVACLLRVDAARWFRGKADLGETFL